jgi:hypothetical protein
MCGFEEGWNRSGPGAARSGPAITLKDSVAIGLFESDRKTYSRGNGRRHSTVVGIEALPPDDLKVLRGSWGTFSKVTLGKEPDIFHE